METKEWRLLPCPRILQQRRRTVQGVAAICRERMFHRLTCVMVSSHHVHPAGELWLWEKVQSLFSSESWEYLQSPLLFRCSGGDVEVVAKLIFLWKKGRWEEAPGKGVSSLSIINALVWVDLPSPLSDGCWHLQRKNPCYVPGPRLGHIPRFPSLGHLSHSWIGEKRAGRTVKEIQHEKGRAFPFLSWPTHSFSLIF